MYFLLDLSQSKWKFTAEQEREWAERRSRGSQLRILQSETWIVSHLTIRTEIHKWTAIFDWFSLWAPCKCAMCHVMMMIHWTSLFPADWRDGRNAKWRMHDDGYVRRARSWYVLGVNWPWIQINSRRGMIIFEWSVKSYQVICHPASTAIRALLGLTNSTVLGSYLVSYRLTLNMTDATDTDEGETRR